ncbi:MAG: hypothetical protein ABEK50_04440 [bacterium]
MTQKAPSTSLRKDIRDRLDRIGSADIILGVPAYNNENTIGSVVEKLTTGVREKFPDRSAVLLVSDGGSLDDTREAARNAHAPDDIPVLVSIYRGLAGKGTALRSVFEAGSHLNAAAGMVVDSDMRTWPAEWTRRHLQPVLENDMDLMTPRYLRHKYDATITNNVCFPLTSVLYGREIRQPIGGDFAFSGDMMKFYASQDQWDTDTARFGIDIWMTTSALCEGYNVGQTHLGAKIHDPKDPGESLGQMFKEVVGTLFRIAGKYREHWWDVDSIEPVPTYADPLDADPEPVPVNRPSLANKAFRLWRNRRNTCRKHLSEETFADVDAVLSTFESDRIEGFLTPGLWSRVLYECLASFNLSGLDRGELMKSMIPLYFARTWSLYNEMDPMLEEEAEQYFHQLLGHFKNKKDSLRERWRLLES